MSWIPRNYHTRVKNIKLARLNNTNHVRIMIRRDGLLADPSVGPVIGWSVVSCLMLLLREMLPRHAVRVQPRAGVLIGRRGRKWRLTEAHRHLEGHGG